MNISYRIQIANENYMLLKLSFNKIKKRFPQILENKSVFFKGNFIQEFSVTNK